MSASPGRPPRRLLREPDFLKLWIGQSISAFGTQITILAVPIVAAMTLKVSPFEFGLLATIEFLPVVVFSLPAGVWVDRFRRRPILIWGDVGRAISLLSIPIAVALNVLTIWQLYVVVLVNGCLTVFFDVAYQSYLPSIVERDQLVDGNAKLELTRSASRRLGPGLAGVLIAILTAPFAILLDAGVPSHRLSRMTRRPGRVRQCGGTSASACATSPAIASCAPLHWPSPSRTYSEPSPTRFSSYSWSPSASSAPR